VIVLAQTIVTKPAISAHSMRATFMTTALENGCSLEDVQRAAGHRDPGTTKLHDRRGSGEVGQLLCDLLSCPE
jgi:site-specific recombinase XerD